MKRAPLICGFVVVAIAVTLGAGSVLLAGRDKGEVDRKIERSKEVKAFLTELSTNSDEKDALINSLETHLKTLSQKLDESLKNLDESEKSRIEAENLSIQAQKELTGLSASWKAYQFWSDVRFYAVTVVAVLSTSWALLLTFGLH